jgi:hypothetical protein
VFPRTSFNVGWYQISLQRLTVKLWNRRYILFPNVSYDEWVLLRDSSNHQVTFGYLMSRAPNDPRGWLQVGGPPKTFDETTLGR